MIKGSFEALPSRKSGNAIDTSSKDRGGGMFQPLRQSKAWFFIEQVSASLWVGELGALRWGKGRSVYGESQKTCLGKEKQGSVALGDGSWGGAQISKPKRKNL